MGKTDALQERRVQLGWVSRWRVSLRAQTERADRLGSPVRVLAVVDQVALERLAPQVKTAVGERLLAPLMRWSISLLREVLAPTVAQVAAAVAAVAAVGERVPVVALRLPCWSCRARRI